jgi:hypothetical protein
LKAWQLITHESTSPTYKRLKKELTEKEIRSRLLQTDRHRQGRSRDDNRVRVR